MKIGRRQGAMKNNEPRTGGPRLRQTRMGTDECKTDCKNHEGRRRAYGKNNEIYRAYGGGD